MQLSAVRRRAPCPSSVSGGGVGETFGSLASFAIMIGSCEGGQHLPTPIKPGVERIYSKRISLQISFERE
jgi:hypothetical protein